jgi:recombination associated protein RdgC
MWFKNIKVYRLAGTFSSTAEQLEASLQKEQFVSAGAAAPQSMGWIAPLENDGRLVYSVGKQILCAHRAEKKLLPASVINQFVKVRAQALEDQQGFKPGRKQMKDLKLEVTESLIPRAFSLQRDTRVWLDPVNYWLAIDTASTSKAEEILSALGKALYPFPVEPVHVSVSPMTAMTNWMLSGDAPANFSIDQDAELRASGEKAAVIRYVKHALDIDEVQKHVKAGKQCTRLAMTWNDKVSFVLTDSMDIKRIAPLDVLDQSDQSMPANELEKFDSDFTLMCTELALLLEGLMDALEEKSLTSKAA